MDKPSLPWSRLAAEFVVIVVGVLIALSADAWFETREERREEQASLVALRSDLEASLDRLAQSNAVRSDIFSALNSMGEDDLTQLPLDSVASLVYTGLFRLGRFVPRVSALRAIEATDRLQLFPRELQTELSELNWLMQRVRDADEGLRTAQENLVDPFLVSRLSLGQYFADFDGLDVSLRTSSPLDVGVLMSPLAQSVALFKSAIFKTGTPRRRELEDQLTLLMGLIDQRLAELGPS